MKASLVVPVFENMPANARNLGLIFAVGGSHMPWSSKACKPKLLKPAHPRAHTQQQKKPLQ